MTMLFPTLLVAYGLLVGLWPIAWLVAIAREAVARRWPAVSRLALLLPLWTVAVSVGGLQVGTLMAAPQAAQPSPRPLIAATSLAVALCVGVLAWLLLLRVTRRRPGADANN